MPTPVKTITEWITEKQQKPAELWREILYQLRQLSTDVWNGVRFFVTVNVVVLGGIATVANGQARGWTTAILLASLAVVGTLFTLVAREILKKQREYYLQVLVKKALFEEEIGLYDVTLSGVDIDLSLPWGIAKSEVQAMKRDHSGWRSSRRRATGTITRHLFHVYEGMLVIYGLVLVYVAIGICQGLFWRT
jgi:hypothetical protein